MIQQLNSQQFATLLEPGRHLAVFRAWRDMA